jgi:putative transcriptional regulator
MLMFKPALTGVLVASPQMVDVFFSKTVILLCDYSEEGAMGIVINRLTGIETNQVLDQMGVPARGGLHGPVLWGGPVQPGAVFVTFKREGLGAEDAAVDDPEDRIFEISSTLAISPSKTVIEQAAAAVDISGAFLSLGYAGWGPGQLDEEIESGSWIYMELDDDLVFGVPPHERWDRHIASMGVPAEMIWMQPINE